MFIDDDDNGGGGASHGRASDHADSGLRLRRRRTSTWLLSSMQQRAIGVGFQELTPIPPAPRPWNGGEAAEQNARAAAELAMAH